MNTKAKWQAYVQVIGEWLRARSLHLVHLQVAVSQRIDGRAHLVEGPPARFEAIERHSDVVDREENITNGRLQLLVT